MLGLLTLSWSIGCAPAKGWLYTDTVEPFCTNMHNTPVGERVGVANTKQLKIPYLAPGLTAVWSSNALADAARNAGITKLQYCDLYTWSLLGGIWQQDNIIVYGE